MSLNAMPTVRWAGSKFFDNGSSLLGDDSVVPGGLTPSSNSPTGTPEAYKYLGWYLRGQSPAVNKSIRDNAANQIGSRTYNTALDNYKKAKMKSLAYFLHDPAIPGAVETSDLEKSFDTVSGAAMS